MKIYYAASNSTPQFVVEAETMEEREILKMFCNYDYYRGEEYEFCMHGRCYKFGFNGVSSFNFGYRKKQKPKWWQFWK